jgi:uncharacterized protein GlcG (DUF336 family)
VLTTRNLDLEDARVLLAGAVKRAEEIGVPMCIALTDAAGVLIAFERMDGGKVSSVSIAVDKAFTAAAARRETAFYGDAENPHSPAWRIHGTNGGRFSTIGGGLPIVVDGQVVGGIGVSSGSQAQDIDVATAGVLHFETAGQPAPAST